MNLKNDFVVYSYQELIDLCKKLREEEPNKQYKIKVKDAICRGNYIFDFSNFIISFENCCLSSSLYARMKDEYGIEFTTFKTPTLKIYGDNNVFINMKVVNDKGDCKTYGQEVSVAIYNADNFFINCHFISYQDTLFLAPFSSDLEERYKGFLPDREIEHFYQGQINYFYKCKIEGSVDFIFGAGDALFNGCEFDSRDDNRDSYVFAPSHSKDDEFGFYCINCNFTCENLKKQADSVYYARPWRDYGMTIIDECKIQDHIKEEGFSNWSNVNRSQTCRFYIKPFNEKIKLASLYIKKNIHEEANKKLLEMLQKLD